MKTDPVPQSDECFVPHVGWFTCEAGDAVLRGLREGDFESLELAAVARLLRAGDIVVDAGAHAGLYTRLAATFAAPGGRILAIEPSPTSLGLLRTNVAPLDPSLVSVHACALAREDGPLSLLAGGPGAAAYNRVQPPDGNAATPSVPGRTLVSLLRETGLDRVDFLKLDVEGGEIAALEGAAPLLASGAIGILMVEFNTENLHRAGGSCEALSRLLTDHGYALFGLDPESLTPVPVGTVQEVAYANYFATRDAAGLRSRLAAAPEPARRAAEEIRRRGAWVRSQRTATQAELARQEEYIAALKQELARLEAEAGDARREAGRLATECERLLADRTEAGRIAQQHIDRLLAERREAQATAQATIDRLLADGRHFAKVMEEQNAYIASLERERDRLRAEAAARSGRRD